MTLSEVRVVLLVKEGGRGWERDGQWQGGGRQEGKMKKVAWKKLYRRPCHHALSTESLLPLCRSVTLDAALGKNNHH